MTMKYYKKTGDAAHIFILTNAAIFAYAVVMHNESKIFDKVWRPDGFCISNKSVPHFNSHDLCLYFDTIGAIAAGMIYYFFNDTAGMGDANELVKNNIFGIFAHGLGHGQLSHAMIQTSVMTHSQSQSLEDVFDIIANASLMGLIQQFGPVLFFWTFLLKASMPNESYRKVVGPLAVIASVLQIIVPPQFGFTYVQTVLLFAFSFKQLMRPDVEKNEIYARYPIYVGCPLSVIAWIESTQCTNFVMGMGGHLIYDAYIVISMIYFYIVCWKDCFQSKVQACT